MRRAGSALHRAVAASVGLHALIAAGLVLLDRTGADRNGPGLQARIDTRAIVQLRFAPEVEPPAELPVAPVEPPSAPRESGNRPPEPMPADPRPPQVETIRVPRTLPPEILAILRSATGRQPGVTAPEPSSASPPVEPAGGPPSAASPASPIHGALSPNRSIVYVLDSSGSMGEWGKFDAARRALIATLREQPSTVRFQVVVYAGAVDFPLQVRGRLPIAATAEFVEQMAGALHALGAPAGRSQHLQAVRTAIDLKPDLVLILTDAADLPVDSIRALVQAAPTPATVCIARVTANKVEAPVALK
jgi:hypothetical protein